MPAVRLQKFLSSAGVAARRKAEVLITAGRVMVNGEVVTKLGSKVDPARDRVMVDGVGVYAEELFYALLNKPKGCLTTVTDPWDRPTVMEYLPKLPASVTPVGRLDFYSEGVLLFTNDGELSAALQAPRGKVEKVYHVKVRGRISESALDKLREGVRLDGGYRTRPADVDRLKTQSKHEWLQVTLTEGKSRQIHRMMEALGHQVIKLQRVSFGGLAFHGLRVGDARELTQPELVGLYRAAGLKMSERTLARGKWKAKREDSDRPRRARHKARLEAEAEADATASKPDSRFGPGDRPPSRTASAKSNTRGSAAKTKSRSAAKTKPRSAAKTKPRSAAKTKPRSAAKTKPRGAAKTKPRGAAKSKPRASGAGRSGARTKPAPAKRAGKSPARRGGKAPARRTGKAPAKRGAKSTGRSRGAATGAPRRGRRK